MPLVNNIKVNQLNTKFNTVKHKRAIFKFSKNQSIIYKFIKFILLSILLRQDLMSRNQNLFRNVNKNLALAPNQDQNKTKNLGNLKEKKDQVSQMTKLPLVNSKNQNSLLTTYRNEPSEQEKEQKKWQYLMRFQHLSSKAHYLHNLKFQTLFLSYSLAQKTVQLIGDSLSFEYWAVACMFMSMKYEQIYPPRLKDLSVLVKQIIRFEQYNDAQLKILESINLNLNFISLNTMLSEYLHAANETQKYYIFYLLQIALSQRMLLKKFILNQIILSIMFILSSHRLQFYPNQKIDGIKFDQIQQCSKLIIISQTRAFERHPFIFKKYKSDRMKMVAYGSIPSIESITALLVKRTDKQQRMPQIVGICKDPYQNEMEQQNSKDITSYNSEKNMKKTRILQWD